jgi:hypothetical protein
MASEDFEDEGPDHLIDWLYGARFLDGILQRLMLLDPTSARMKRACM